MPETITCLKCGSVDDYYTEVKAHNNVARCSVCDAFIKNIAYEQPKFYVGKYKGKEISAIEDLSYLKWAKDGMRQLNRKTKEAIQSRIDHLEDLAK